MFKHGDRVFINANGCDPECKECTRSHKPLHGVVLDGKVYVLYNGKGTPLKRYCRV